MVCVIMNSSNIKDALLGDTRRYSRILRKHADFLSERYPDRLLSKCLGEMPERFVSIGPMSNCDALLSDLGIKAPDNLLAGIGMIAFHISTYDDIVDEPPSSREKVAALAYSGNIALIEGIELMVDSGLTAPMSAALEEIKRNSYMQQKVTGILWRKKYPDKEGYFRGIMHIVSWASIGPMAALAYAEKTGSCSSVERFCKNYGIAIQIIDDINEIGDDLKNGYRSLPIIEARKRGIDLTRRTREKTELLESFKDEALTRLDSAKSAIPKEWTNLGEKADMLKRYIGRLRC